jgi:hypothetical protein
MRIFLLFLIFVKITITHSLNNIWFIRHCDKPNNSNNPCCSEIGYERSIAWYDYLKTKINKRSNIKFYASGFAEEKVCDYFTNHKKYKANKQCQKSQRMFLTCNIIYNNFSNDNQYLINNFINLNYCVGEEKDLLNSVIKNANKHDDVVIVWEHNGIIDILNMLNLDINFWKKKYKNMYDIIFKYDYKNHKLTYYCYDYKTKNIKCDKDIDQWFKKSFLKFIDSSTTFLLLIFVFLIFMLLIIVFYKKYVRNGYVEIY